ncbi:MAG: ribonuclease E/G [Pseudomonadota bacterium]
MSRIIAIEPGPPAKVALVVDGKLEDLLVDPPENDETPMPEEIHRVRVRRVIPKQGAAHVKLGDGKGFLREAKGVAEGDLVVAQVSGFAEPGKGAPLTARRLHRGRYAILTPEAPGVNVARSVKDKEERARLEAAGLKALDGAALGLIVRSAAVDADEDAIREDVADLLALEAAVAEDGGPGLIAEAPGAEVYAWREWGDPDEVIREDGVFERMGLWDAIDALRSPRAALPGGGWMSVEPTTALVAVDVNTGGDMSPEAAAKANLAACADLPRQLRMRGLGGQITVDFAPMRKNDRKAVESAFRKAFAADGIQTTLAGWTPLGHFELLRKRERRPLTEVLGDG